MGSEYKVLKKDIFSISYVLDLMLRIYIWLRYFLQVLCKDCRAKYEGVYLSFFSLIQVDVIGYTNFWLKLYY